MPGYESQSASPPAALRQPEPASKRAVHVSRRGWAPSCGPNAAASAAMASAAEPDALVPRPFALPSAALLFNWLRVSTRAALPMRACSRTNCRQRTTRSYSRPLAGTPPIVTSSAASPGSNCTQVNVCAASLLREMLGRYAVRQSQSASP